MKRRVEQIQPELCAYPNITAGERQSSKSRADILLKRKLFNAVSLFIQPKIVRLYIHQVIVCIQRFYYTPRSSRQPELHGAIVLNRYGRTIGFCFGIEYIYAMAGAAHD